MGIIAAIIIPRVIVIINSSKEKSQLISTDNYVNAVNQQLLANDAEKVVEDGIYEIKDRSICKESECIELEYEGDSPKEGTIIVKDTQVRKALNVLYDKKYISKLKGEKSKFKYIPNVDILEGLTPVIYRDNKWVVVDIADNWYDYDKQEWANAVILNDNITKSIGDTVDVNSEVKAMLVYVPRYEYKIEGTYGKGGTSKNSPGEIEINFISKTQEASNKYRIHPAFKFGEEELDGIWVGKFETTGTSDNPTILPSETSLTNQNVSEQFTTSRKFNKYISGDSHMAKNSEWGAIAYLSQSKYGKYGNSNYTGINKEVMINNCSKRITGIGADNQNDDASSSTCTTNTYDTSKGQAASTTGNITGIYDMSGGSWEYTMGVLVDSNGKPRSGYTEDNNSGYSGMLSDETMYTSKSFPNTKYYDLYTPTTKAETLCNNETCYGHALGETKSWYGDYPNFVTSNYPWLRRGGYYGNKDQAGVFYSLNGGGNIGKSVSFRTIIVDTKKQDKSITVYSWKDDTINIGDTIDPSDTTKFRANPIGHHYLKHVVDGDNKVTESYACAVFNGEETCVRGGSSAYYGYAENASEYTGNALILKNLQNKGIRCTFGESYSFCSYGFVDLYAYSDGDVSSGDIVDDVYYTCDVGGNGSSSCLSH